MAPAGGGGGGQPGRTGGGWGRGREPAAAAAQRRPPPPRRRRRRRSPWRAGPSPRAAPRALRPRRPPARGRARRPPGRTASRGLPPPAEPEPAPRGAPGDRRRRGRPSGASAPGSAHTRAVGAPSELKRGWDAASSPRTLPARVEPGAPRGLSLAAGRELLHPRPRRSGLTLGQCVRLGTATARGACGSASPRTPSRQSLLRAALREGPGGEGGSGAVFVFQAWVFITPTF